MKTTLEKLWCNYLKITPTIKHVKAALNLNDYSSFCDHIAFRTIVDKKEGITLNGTSNYGMQKMSSYFIEQGYEIKQHYFFKEKKLNAIHLEKTHSPKILELYINGCFHIIHLDLLFL